MVTKTIAKFIVLTDSSATATEMKQLEVLAS
jgi:hypothetical protein